MACIAPLSSRRPSLLILFIVLYCQKVNSQSFGGKCDHSLSQASAQTDSIIQGLPRRHVNSTAQFRQIADAAWSPQAPLPRQPQFIFVTSPVLNFTGDEGVFECVHGGMLVIEGDPSVPVKLLGLDIRVLASSCTLIMSRINFEQCGSDGLGECFSLRQCPIVVFSFASISVVGFSTSPSTHTAALFTRSVVLCTNCTAFPSFGADFLVGDSTRFGCVPLGSCAIDFRVSMLVVNSNALTVTGFKFLRCAIAPQPPGDLVLGTSCFTVQFSPSPSMVFTNCEFVTGSGMQPWMSSSTNLEFSVIGSVFKFDGSVVGGELTWPLPSEAVLTDVWFVCVTLPSPCVLSDPQVTLHASSNLLFTALDMVACHSSHCMVVMRSNNVTIEKSTFADATYPFLRFVDSQWTVRSSSFSDLNASTFAPSMVTRTWFPDYYRHDSYSGAISSTFTSTRNVECVLSDVVFQNLTSRNDSATKSWGLGGAVFLLFTGDSSAAVVHLIRVNMTSTSSGGMGGCLYVAFDGTSSHNLVLLDNTTFHRCSSGVRAGAMHTVHNGNSGNNSLLLRDVVFDSCHSHIAAGAFNVFLRQNVTRVYPPVQRPFDGHVHLLRCHFRNNHVVLDASSVQVWSYLPFGESSLPMVIEDCSFINNHAHHGQGAVVTYEQPIILRGNTVFFNNSNTAIFLTHTSMIAEGAIVFENNTGRDYGGAVGLVENCFFYIVPGTSIHFGGNKACKGPAVFVNPGVQQSIGAVGNRHSVCSLQLAVTIDITDDEISNASSLANISFDGPYPNSCPANGKETCDQEVCSKDVYITSLSDCVQTYRSSLDASIPYSDLPKIDQVFLHLLSFNVNKTILRITTDASALRLNRSRPLSGYPGQEISLLGLEVTDQARARTVASVYLAVVNSTLRQFVSITPELVLVQRAGHQPPTIHVEIEKSFYRTLMAEQQSVAITLQFTLVHSSFTVTNSTTLHLQRCPPGFDVSAKGKVCTYVGSDGVNGSVVLAHDLQSGHIYLETGYWGYHDNSSNRIYAWRCPLFYCACTRDPTSAYPGCIFNPLEPDLQCNTYRQGTLCGACKTNYTTRLFGTACRSCPYSHRVIGWIVLVIFIIGTMAVAGLVLYYNVGIPQELLGVLFFLQTCYYASDPGSPITTNWVNARPDDDSFAEVIFNPCISTGWQPLDSVVMNYALVMVGASVIALVYLLTRCGFIQILATRSSLNGVWLIFLLTYTTSTDTVLKVLRCVVADPHGQRRFYYNGDIYCFNFQGRNDGGWLGWGIFSMIFILVLIIPTPFLMFFLSKGYFKSMKQFRDIIESSYVEERRWWAGVDLLRRLVLAVIYFNAQSAAQRKVGMAVLSFVLLAVHCVGKPYKKAWVNYSEALVLFDFFILCVLGLDGKLRRVSNASVSEAPGFVFLLLPILYGIVLVCRRLYLRIRRKGVDSELLREQSDAATASIRDNASNGKLLSSLSQTFPRGRQDSSMPCNGASDEGQCHQQHHQHHQQQQHQKQHKQHQHQATRDEDACANSDIAVPHTGHRP